MITCTCHPMTITGVAGGTIALDEGKKLYTGQTASVTLSNIRVNRAVQPITGSNNTASITLSGATCLVEYIKSITATNSVVKIYRDNINATVTGGTVQDMHGARGTKTLTNATLTGVQEMYSNERIILDNCNVTGQMCFNGGYQNGRLYLKNYNKFPSSRVFGRSGNTTSIIYMITGTTADFKGNNTYNRVLEAPVAIKVGTFDNATALTGTWTTGGTATVITTSGATIKVEGEGTYIDKDGTTNLTVVS